MRLTSLSVDHFRSIEGFEVDLPEGTTSIHGPNGAGKTNLLEALFFGLTSRSFRTSDRRDLVPFGSRLARVRVGVQDPDGIDHEFMTGFSRDEGASAMLDGAPVERAEADRYRPPVVVFSPDRLELVKGPPALRRAHLDSFVAARWTSRTDLRREFGRALAQRNALLSSIARGEASDSQLGAWDAQLASKGSQLALAREEATSELAPGYREVCERIGLEAENDLIYRPSAGTSEEEIRQGLEQRRTGDIEAGRTTWGPHHDELRLEFDGRQLRRFGSQGQQRLGLLALMFAERLALVEAGTPIPVMLLDDVMSELDLTRRNYLLGLLSGGGQTVLTAADPTSVPDAEGLNRVTLQSIPADQQEQVPTPEGRVD